MGSFLKRFEDRYQPCVQAAVPPRRLGNSHPHQRLFLHTFLDGNNVEISSITIIVDIT